MIPSLHNFLNRTHSISCSFRWRGKEAYGIGFSPFVCFCIRPSERPTPATKLEVLRQCMTMMMMMVLVAQSTQPNTGSQPVSSADEGHNFGVGAWFNLEESGDSYTPTSRLTSRPFRIRRRPRIYTPVQPGGTTWDSYVIHKTKKS